MQNLEDIAEKKKTFDIPYTVSFPSDTYQNQSFKEQFEFQKYEVSHLNEIDENK